MTSEHPDHYATLGVGRGASHEELQAAYRCLALRHHPDKNKGNEEAATARFQKVQKAFEALRDEEKPTIQHVRQPSTATRDSSSEENPFAWFDNNWGPNFSRKRTEPQQRRDDWGKGPRATGWSGDRGWRSMDMGMNFGFHTPAQHPGFGVFGRLFTHLPPLPPLELRLQHYRRDYSWRERRSSISTRACS
ncbi:DnaJ domain-containing protein [Nemania sp. NC0429]|nr:DnaJ domain-containing protein [Nemania sp. NC0429]